MTVNVRIEGQVLRYVVATAKHSALDGPGAEEAVTALRAIASGDPAAAGQVGAVLLTSDAPNFCSGGNVRGFTAEGDRRALIHGQAHHLHRLARALAATEVPVVAAVHGWAAGAGMSLACLADITVGGPSTKLRPAYPGIGFSPDGGMTWTLPRIVGTKRARDILLTDRVLTGDEAYQLGLLTRLVPDDQVAAEARAIAEQLAAGPRTAYRHIKRLLTAAGHDQFEHHLALEADAIADSADSPESRARVDAFLARH
jgi:2-(1,2-epoxy-1,2-dihydrophenyl)acetyl-CoA isomerase